MIKSFLEKNKSVLSVNVEKSLDFELDNKNRLLPDESLTDDFSLYDQYVKEKDECSKYRVILNINPVCSNVLFNAITEIVVNEGSNNCKCLNFVSLDKSSYAENAINTSDPITYGLAIRNTEYSNPENGSFVYHCGIDIFNNHMLRKKNFIHVNKTNDESTTSYIEKKVYNTIGDYLRDNNGNIVKENLNIKYNFSSSGNTESKMHLYGTDSLYSLKNAFYNRCKEVDGWWGFTNPNTINIPNSDNKDVTINEMLSNKKPCEFIDFYPDRSLFSFVPKYNNERRRIEKNWDYCLTYPFMKDYNLINKICGGKNGEVKARFKIVTNSNGVKLFQCTSFFKHTLLPNSRINFYYYITEDNTSSNTVVNYKNMIQPLTTNVYEDNVVQENNRNYGRNVNDLSLQKYDKETLIYSIGDLNGENKDRIFSVKYDDIKTIYDFFIENGCFYKKVNRGCECDYYARIFKKLKNENNVPLINDINKTAFSKNIYGDDIAQIIFTDDVELYGLTDENDRDVSEIYFTTIKRNAGNEKWYKNKTVSDLSVEYSHCFGKVTSGIDFSGVDVNEEPFDYNVHYLHNMDSGVCVDNKQAQKTFSAWGETILTGMPKFLESGITLENDLFYGDIVEFDNYEYKTSSIANICHRFNTMQRETFDSCFRDMYQDVVTYDDYDSANLNHSFAVKTYYCNDIINANHDIENLEESIDNLIYCNIFPEGYFYKPHYKLQLKQYGDVRHSIAEYINYDKYKLTGQNVIYIYKTTSEGETLIGKKYIYDYFDFGNIDDYGRASSSEGGGVGTIHTVDAVEGCLLKVNTPKDFDFIIGDYVAIYDKITKHIFWGVIKSYSKLELIVYFDESCFKGMDVLNHPEYFAPNNVERRFFMFWSQDSVPFYAKLCLETQEFSWRPLLKQSEIDKNDELSSLPFSNGRLYLQKNINFFLKRQDPYGKYGLSHPLFKKENQMISNPMIKFIPYGKYDPEINLGLLFNNSVNACY